MLSDYSRIYSIDYEVTRRTNMVSGAFLTLCCVSSKAVRVTPVIIIQHESVEDQDSKNGRCRSFAT